MTLIGGVLQLGRPHGNDLYKAMCESRKHFKCKLRAWKRKEREMGWSDLAKCQVWTEALCSSLLVKKHVLVQQKFESACVKPNPSNRLYTYT